MKITILKNISNSPIVKLSTREFPGIVIQGDTLFSMLTLVKNTKKEINNHNFDNALDNISQLKDDLEALINTYETTLVEQNIKLPYNK